MSRRMRGKTVGARFYFHKDHLDEATPADRDLVKQATAANSADTDSFNIVRITQEKQEVAFLLYPELGSEPFPALAASQRVHVPSKLRSLRDYRASLNPPILHRTELFLPEGHPVKASLIALTNECERLGLFENTAVIGFQRQWSELIRQKGYEVRGFELVPIANDESNGERHESLELSDGEVRIQRHLTALSRHTISAPVQALLRHRLLNYETTFFDYGCGKGDDLAAVTEAGIQGSGWDPYFRSECERKNADVVNLGFVINVIEDREERIDALQSAFGLANQVLAVAAMLSSSDARNGKSYADGLLTSRGTFQKYYTQAELQQFIESTLDQDAYPAGPGVFLVFKDRGAEQQYLSKKTHNSARVLLVRANADRAARVPQPPQRTKQAAAVDPRIQACADKLWRQLLELGRAPEEEELSNAAELNDLFGSVSRAIRHCMSVGDRSEFAAAQESRKADILVMLALRKFERRKRIDDLYGPLKRDIRALFGSLKAAEAEAISLLFSVQDTAKIADACESAANQGLGHLEPGHSLQLHSSLIERLPAVLRIFIGCATALVGDIRNYDLVKAHIDSGKVTLMSFDNFLGRPVPRMQTRIKVRLRDQDMDVFEYDDATYPPPLLFNKSRFINEEFPKYEELQEFEEAINALGIFDLSGYGPSAAEFFDTLRAYRYEIDDHRLVRASSIPTVEEKCGRLYNFEDLIQCGETWERTKVDNIPKQPETYNALADLARLILEPVIDYFGGIKLTYCFASSALTKNIGRGIAPKLDQHSSCELNTRGALICDRAGAAVDFVVEDEDMAEVANWVAIHCQFDRLYFYGKDRPTHVSIGPDNSRALFVVSEKNGRRIPKVVTAIQNRGSVDAVPHR